MKFGRGYDIARSTLILSLVLFLFFMSGILLSAEEYTLDLDEFEKKSFEWGGFAEFQWEHMQLNRDSVFYPLTFGRDSPSTLDLITPLIQLEGNVDKDVTSFIWLLQASAQYDQTDWLGNADIFEAYASIKPTPKASIDLGKKRSKWGKGYAWNPVAVIDRLKDPNNPELAQEGYVGAGLDLIRSFSTPLQNAAFTAVFLPVTSEVNEDFGTEGANLATKLYLLYMDTDIDFIWFTGESRATQYGVDFAKNLASNLEVHGELLYVPEQKKRVLSPEGNITTREVVNTSYLLGMRYLTENDITAIVEFYHNGAGYSEAEMDRFYQFVADAGDDFLATGDPGFLDEALRLNQSGYNRPQSGYNYLYLRITQKDPFDFLYFTPGLTAIINLEDQSFSVMPEAIYSGFTNWEWRLRFSLLNGDNFTEYGEKLNNSKLELRVRYFF